MFSDHEVRLEIKYENTCINNLRVKEDAMVKI